MSMMFGSGDDYISPYSKLTKEEREEYDKQREEKRILKEAQENINIIIRLNKLEAQNASYRLTIKLLKDEIVQLKDEIVQFKNVGL